ncbi:hypothetical protein HHI36_011586 [Cryptolaemus montrouzieri]|uniref:Uncharacterized protein n=1 Tax=Cryptolaemus montrouzieri TaxID=559131 RepID=A0ABD2MM82_9CUCU
MNFLIFPLFFTIMFSTCLNVEVESHPIVPRSATIICEENYVLLRGLCRKVVVKQTCQNGFKLIRGECRAVISATKVAS